MPEALQYAGWLPYGKQIYDRLKQTDTLDVAAWSIFRAAFPEDIDQSFHIRVREKWGSPPTELESISQRLSLPVFNCLTFLDIQELKLGFGDLMTLTNIPNLAVLALKQHLPNIPNDEYVNDRAMRNWGRAVQEKGTYQKLKVLILHNFFINLEDTLSALSSFPSLYLVNMNSSQLEHYVLGMKEGRLISDGRWQYLPTTDSEYP